MMNDFTRPLECTPSSRALKAYFLGPIAENYPWFTKELLLILNRWFSWRKQIGNESGIAISEEDQSLPEFLENQKQIHRAIDELGTRLEKELPKFSPRYLAHMFSETSLTGLFGHFFALLHNPNLISNEVAPVAALVEKEAIQSLSEMVGYDPIQASGHFTSGGTLANFEAIHRAIATHFAWYEARLNKPLSHLSIHERISLIQTELEPKYQGPTLLVPSHRHYSWDKAIRIFGMGQSQLEFVNLNTEGKMDPSHLKELVIHNRNLGRPPAMVVTVVGTTELGTVDPLMEISEVLNDSLQPNVPPIWHHADAAYGGFFATLLNDNTNGSSIASSLKHDLAALKHADSVTLDPHKLAYVPYSSGAFLCKTKVQYEINRTWAHYLELADHESRGPYTIEGSRSASGAFSIWLTGKTLGLNENGLGKILLRTIGIRMKLGNRLVEILPSARIIPGCDTNILGLHFADEGERLSSSNQRTEFMASLLSPQSKGDFILSKTTIPRKFHEHYLDSWTKSWSCVADADHISLLRICLMNPFYDSKELEIHCTEDLVETLSNAWRQSK